jgi:MoxR-like ATPase
VETERCSSAGPELSEELFGAISLKALEQARFARVVTGKLPEADFAFVDEIFKANSAILNSLLSLVNERGFHNDGLPVSCPLVTMFGASNELPEGKELEALFDHFLLRFEVVYLLRPGNLKLVLAAPDQPGPRSRCVLRSAWGAWDCVQYRQVLRCRHRGQSAGGLAS